jgi:hypothetical protein
MNYLMEQRWWELASMAVVAGASEHGGGSSSQRACLLYFFLFVFLSLSLRGEVPALITKRHHCQRYAIVGSKSSSEGGILNRQ